MPTTDHRTLIESERFKGELAQIAPNIVRWDEVFRGVQWGLCRKPQLVGQLTAADGIYAVATDDWPGVPSVVVYYKFDDKTVTLLSVILAETEAP